MSAWILLTVAGAFLQNVRSLLQRRLTGELSVNGAAYVRFLFAMPFAALFWLFSPQLVDAELVVTANAEFWSFVAIGALTQMIATSALVLSLIHI